VSEPNSNKPSVSRELFVLGLIFLAAAAVCYPFLKCGAPNGHSISYNLAWLGNFSAQLLHGDLYPRWLANMNDGAGSPVFFFYAPLPFYISSIAVALFHSAKLGVQLAVGEWLLLALSGAAFYLFARWRFSALPAALGAVLYMLLPYHFEIDLWRRQDIGELTNYIWMPLILFGIDRLHAGKNNIVLLAVAYSLMIFSHVPSALLFSICMGAYILLRYSDGRSRPFLLRTGYALCIGVLLSGVYLFPALFTEQYISTENLWNSYLDYHLWFQPITGTMRSAFTDRLFVVLCATTLIFIVSWLNVWRHRDGARLQMLTPWLLLAAVAWFLMLRISTPLWSVTPFLAKVQFPWRVAMVLDLATAGICVYTFQLLVTKPDRITCASAAVIVALLLGCVYSGRNVVGNLDPYEDAHYIHDRDSEVRAGHDAPEYTTAWTRLATHGKNLDDIHLQLRNWLYFDRSKGHMRIADWEPGKILLDVHLHRRINVIIRQFYFPGWRAHIVGDDHALPLRPGKGLGLMEITLPRGRYKLELLMMPIWQQQVGTLLSSCGVLLLMVSAYRSRQRQRGLSPGRLETSLPA
jgi:hypothetical protein